MKHTSRAGLFSVAFLIVAVGLSGCTGGTLSPNQGPSGTYPVALEFQGFYAELGGMAVLGPAISQAFFQDGRLVQYTQSALMVLNPNLAGEQAFSLAPLGKELGYAEAAGAADEETPQVDGYTSDPALLLAYNVLGGEAVFGKPLTNRRINQRYNWVEQHFETMGLAHWVDDPDGPAFILAYGAYACDSLCDPYQLPDDLKVDDTRPALPLEIEGFATQFGKGLLGNYLAGPFELPEGGQEVMYEGMVLYTDPQSPGNAFIRDLSLMVGIQPDPPVARFNNEFIVFIAVEDGLGYNIPVFFYDFIAAHGGLKMSGDPITEFRKFSTGVYQQCFTNLCLLFDESKPAGLQIQPRALGLEYRTLFYGTQPDEPALNGVTLNIWEGSSPVTSQQSQTLYIIVLADGKGLAGVQPRLSVFLPDGSVETGVFPPTDSQGQSAFTVGPVQGPNGTWINYDVCFEYPGDEVCVAEQYFLWGNP